MSTLNFPSVLLYVTSRPKYRPHNFDSNGNNNFFTTIHQNGVCLVFCLLYQHTDCFCSYSLRKMCSYRQCDINTDWLGIHTSSSSFLTYRPEIYRQKSLQSDIVSAIRADFQLRFLNMTLTHEMIFFPFFPTGTYRKLSSHFEM